MRTKFVMLAQKYNGLNLLLLRRTLPELRENHMIPMQKLLAGIVNYNATERVFTFPNGSRIKLGYCAAEGDVYQYQGQEYDVIGLEEATHFTETQMIFLTTCNRTTRSDFTPRMYYTMNPGGVGHAWVKRIFIDRQYKRTENPNDYVFIPARIYDNPVLLNNDPGYLQTLKNLPDDLRRAHLDGDWDLHVGQYFTEFRRAIHVCEPFPIKDYWQCYRAFDYGLDMLACLWAAFDELGNCYIYKELCEPNLVISEAARRMRNNTLNKEPIVCTFAPADMWSRNRDSGKSQADLYADYGLPLVQVRNGRVDGWLNLKEWFKNVQNGAGQSEPRLHIFSNCTELIRCIPLLQHDEKNPSDCATEPHDITHAPDALRYLMDGRPQPADIQRAPAYDKPEDYEDQVEDFMTYGS